MALSRPSHDVKILRKRVRVKVSEHNNSAEVMGGTSDRGSFFQAHGA
jgi:hypothetical protein